MRLLTAALLLALVGAAPAADPKEEAKRLEGAYEVLAVSIGGKPDPKKDTLKGVEIKNGEFVIREAKRDAPATFTLDPSKTPPHIDLALFNLVKMPGIYETKETDQGLELTVAINLGEKAERPTDFKGAGKEEVVFKLLRKKPK
jgi:uncharacterized protein (TIGR03067 family)